MDKRGGGVSRFSVENFLSHSAENFRRGILYCCIDFGYRKSLNKRWGGSIKIFRRKFFVSQCRKISYGKPSVLCFRKFPVAKKYMDKGGGIKIFRRKPFVSQCQKISYLKPSALCFKKFPVAKKFMDKRGGGVSRFSVENFLSHSAENFRRGIFYCCIDFGYRKSLDKRGGEYQDFPSKIFCLTVPKNFVREAFCAVFQKISGSQKVYG